MLVAQQNHLTTRLSSYLICITFIRFHHGVARIILFLCIYLVAHWLWKPLRWNSYHNGCSHNASLAPHCDLTGNMNLTVLTAAQWPENPGTEMVEKYCLSHLIYIYCQISNTSRTKSQNFNDSHLILQLSLPNILKPCVKSRMKM